MSKYATLCPFSIEGYSANINVKNVTCPLLGEHSGRTLGKLLSGRYSALIWYIYETVEQSSNTVRRQPDKYGRIFFTVGPYTGGCGRPMIRAVLCVYIYESSKQLDELNNTYGGSVCTQRVLTVV